MIASTIQLKSYQITTQNGVFYYQKGNKTRRFFVFLHFQKCVHLRESVLRLLCCILPSQRTTRPPTAFSSLRNEFSKLWRNRTIQSIAFLWVLHPLSQYLSAQKFGSIRIINFRMLKNDHRFLCWLRNHEFLALASVTLRDAERREFTQIMPSGW